MEPQANFALRKFFPLVKYDDIEGIAYGLATSETPDADGEVCDYEPAKKAYKQWSDDQLAKTAASGQELSLGNIRIMHQLQIGGKAIAIDYKDAEKQIWVTAKAGTPEARELLKGGYVTGFSHAGDYGYKEQRGKYVHYAPIIKELSFVDSPCNPDATFAYVKADGSVEMRKFVKPGIESLSKADVDRIAAAVAESLPEAELVKLHKTIDELTARLRGLEGKTMDELTLEKAKGGFAALHGALKKASALHEKMAEHHEKASEMHKAMGEHLADCMKACSGMSGEDGKAITAETLCKLFGVEPILEGKKDKKDEDDKDKGKPKADASSTLTKADVAKLVVDGVAAALEAQDKDPARKARLFLIPAPGQLTAKDEAGATPSVEQNGEALGDAMAKAL
jgi:hypothetical protein